MNAREQAAHVLRRFGLGASPEELERYEKLPPTKIVENLLDFDRTDEGFPISPYELVAQAYQGMGHLVNDDEVEHARALLAAAAGDR